MDAGPIDAGLDAGMPFDAGGAIDAGATMDGGAGGYCGAGVDAGPLADGGGGLQPLPPGFAYGRCYSVLPFRDNLLRGPGAWTTTLDNGSRTSPVELDAGQTLTVRMFLGFEATGWAHFGGGPCKDPGGIPLTTYTAASAQNGYLMLRRSRVVRFEVEISGAVAAPYCAPCDTSRAIDVALGTPFLLGSPFDIGPELETPNRLSASSAVSCTGVRHLGGDALWRVRLEAGQQLSAYAANTASLGEDPLAFYLVRDCADLSQCVRSNFDYSGAASNYVAPTAETLYLVLDTFGWDRGPNYVRVEVTVP